MRVAIQQVLHTPAKMVRLSLTFPLLAVLSVVSSSLAMRIDARPPTDRVQLSRRQFSVPSISQAQYNAGVQSQCQELQPELQVGSNTIQGDISSIQSVTSNIEVCSNDRCVWILLN